MKFYLVLFVLLGIFSRFASADTPSDEPSQNCDGQAGNIAIASCVDYEGCSFVDDRHDDVGLPKRPNFKNWLGASR